MNTAFIQELGIRPWDQLNPTNESDFSTISLLGQDFQSAWSTWCKLASLLAGEWPTIVNWRSLGYPYESKTEEYLAIKKFSKTSSSNDIFKKNETTCVYSGVEHLSLTPEEIDSTTLTHYRYSVTLMQKRNVDNDALWKRLSHLTHLSTTEDFKLILLDRLSLAFRFYDAETHGVAQLICHSEHAARVIEKIKILNTEEISKNEVYEYIHRQLNY